MSDKLPPLYLVVQNGPTAGQTFTVDNVSQTIGRGEDCDISIPDMSLSRHHARIRVTPNGYVLEDLGSTNGSFVNESPVPGGVLLTSGDTIRLGATVSFRADFNPDPGAAMAAAPVAAPAPVPVPAGQAGLGPRTFGLWLLGIAAGLLIILLLVAGLIYFRFLSQAESPPPTQAVALPSPPALPSPIPVDTATPTVETAAEPSPTATTVQVPGMAADDANLQAFPSGALNKVDPFCGRTVEVSAAAPVFMSWQQLLAEADGETDYVAQWLDSVYYEISLDGRPLTEINYHQEGTTLDWWSYLGILPPGNHRLSIRWYTNRPVSTGLDTQPADGQIDTFGPGLAGESFCEIAVPEIIAAATPTPEVTPTPQPIATATPIPQVQAPPPPTPTASPTADSGQAATGTNNSGGYTLTLGSQHRYEGPWGAAWDGDVCKSYLENSWDNSNLSFRGFHLELLLANEADTPVPNGWTPTYTTAGGQSGRFCYHPYPDGRGTEVMPDTTGSVTFFALVPAEDYVNNVRLEVNGQVLQFCLNSNGDYCSGGQVASQPALPGQTPAPPAPSSPPSIEAYVTDDDGCIVYGWNVQNVKEIYFDGEGVPGTGQHWDCDEDDNDNDNDNNDNDDNDNNDNNDNRSHDGDVDNPILRIVHLDGRIEEINLEPDDDNRYWRD